MTNPLYLKMDIRQRLWFVLALLAFSTLFVGGVAWYTLDRAGARMERLHRQTMIEVTNSLNLSRQSANVARSAPYLLNLQSNYLINKEEQALLETLKSAIGPWPNKTAAKGSPIYIYEEDIAGTIHQMKIAIRDLAKSVTRLRRERDHTLSVARQLDEMEKRLYMLATSDNQSAQQRQVWLTLQAMTNALSGAAHAENLVGVGEKRRAYQRIVREFNTREDARSFSIFVNQLEALAHDPEGVFQTRKRELSHSVDSQNALFRIRFHAGEISNLARQFAQSAEDYLSKEREKTSTSIDVAKFLILFAGVVSITVAVLAAVFVSGYVTKNISAISKAMMKLAQGDRSVELRKKPTSNDEIGRLLQSFRVFRANALRLDRSHTQLHQKNVLFEKIFANISDGVMITSETGHLTGINPNVAQVLRIEDAAIEGRTDINQLFAQTGFAAQVQAAGIDENFRGLTEIQNSDGLTLEIRCSRLPDGGGIWLISDITERREMENRLRQIRQIEKLGKVTGEVAHDFGNIMSTITSNLHMIENGSQQVDQETLLRRIGNATDIGTSLTQRLLAFARKQRLEPEEVELNTLVEGLVDLVGIGLKEGVNLTTELLDVPILVKVDPGQLESAILNLCLNANQAIEGEGEICISVRSKDDSTAIIEVRDEGHGMDENTVSCALEPFFTARRDGKGTGLGLSMVYGFIKQTGGDVQIESALDKGTTITLCLPVFDPAKEQSLEPVGENKTIMLVEDDHIALATTGTLLRTLGFDVLEFDNFGDAQKAMKNKVGIDALLTDLHLDMGQSGWDLARQCLANYHDVNIIVASGRLPDMHPFSNKKEKRVTCLAKPLTAQGVITALKEKQDLGLVV